MVTSPILSSWQKLSTKIITLLVGFLVVALAVIGSTLLLSWQLEGSAAAINVTGSLRMSAYRLMLLLDEPPGSPGAGVRHEQAHAQIAQVNATLQLLRQGDPQRPLILPPAERIRASFEAVVREWENGLRPQAQAVLDGAPPASLQEGARRFVQQADILVQLIERDSEYRTFWLRGSQLGLLALALFGTVSIIYLLFNMIVAPLLRMRHGIERMREQDFDVRLPVESRDEFGQLAQEFNLMADRLQGSYGQLESLVQAKTEALEHQNRELALLYDSASFLQQPQSAEALCEGFLKRIRSYFNADGGSVRVLDPVRGNLHLMVHHGLSDQLIAADHCLKVGDCLCGEAAQKKVAVVHDLRRIDISARRQCQKEGYATVSVFHIFAQRQHLGFFNLHFRESKVFGKDETALLETLGQLLGTAIENQRLAEREREMAISEERNLVAQGLHDSIAQGLNFLNLQVQMLEQSLRQNQIDDVSAIVPALRAGVDESYQDVRELLQNFRTRLQEGNLVQSLQIAIDKFRDKTGIQARLLADGDGAPFAREQQLQILFIVQEALSNVRKHAGASEVRVRLVDNDDFELTIEDNGHGFDPGSRATDGGSHIGIHIMGERARRIEATLEVLSRPGDGTTVRLQLPRAQRRAA